MRRAAVREFDALAGYPQAKQPRVASRTISNKIIATYRGVEFYDGERANGYGGLRDDGRWKPIAASMVEAYGLHAGDAVLQIGSDKGFLLREFAGLGLRARGVEPSHYASERSVVHTLRGGYTSLPFLDCTFDFVIALGAVYTLSLTDAIACLREVERVGAGRSFVTLAAFKTWRDYELMRNWSLLGTTILRREEWVEVLKHVGYRGDYAFVTAETLNLRAA